MRNLSSFVTFVVLYLLRALYSLYLKFLEISIFVFEDYVGKNMTSHVSHFLSPRSSFKFRHVNYQSANVTKIVFLTKFLIILLKYYLLALMITSLSFTTWFLSLNLTGYFIFTYVVLTFSRFIIGWRQKRMYRSFLPQFSLRVLLFMLFRNLWTFDHVPSNLCK